MDLKIDYKPVVGQNEFHRSSSRYKALVGALGSGKTAVGCVEGILQSIEHPGNVGLVARRSLPELKSTTLKRFFEFLPDPLIISYNKTDRELWIKTNGAPSLVHFGPLDEIGRYKSMELGWFFLDEADQTTEDHWLTLCGRLRLKNIPAFGMLATNPTSTSHWIYKKWVVNPTEGYEIFRSKTSDNEVNLPAGYLDELRKTYPEDWQKRYLDGHFGVLQSGDPAFPDFTEAEHVKKIDPIKGLPIIRGWDFGKKHPCCVFCQIDELGRLRIYRTLKGENRDIYEFADMVLAQSRTHFNYWFLRNEFEDYCDIAGKQEHDSGKPSITILQSKRVFPTARYSRIEARVREMRKMMREKLSGVPRILIDPCNQYGIEAFMSACIDDEGKIKKEGYFDHFLDCVGYIVHNTCMVTKGMADSDVVIAEPRWSYRGAMNGIR